MSGSSGPLGAPRSVKGGPRRHDAGSPGQQGQHPAGKKRAASGERGASNGALCRPRRAGAPVPRRPPSVPAARRGMGVDRWTSAGPRGVFPSAVARARAPLLQSCFGNVGSSPRGVPSRRGTRASPRSALEPPRNQDGGERRSSEVSPLETPFPPRRPARSTGRKPTRAAGWVVLARPRGRPAVEGEVTKDQAPKTRSKRPSAPSLS